MDGQVPMCEAHRAVGSWKQITIAPRAKLSFEMVWDTNQVFHTQFAGQFNISISEVKITGQRLTFRLVKKAKYALSGNVFPLRSIGLHLVSHDDCLELSVHLNFLGILPFIGGYPYPRVFL